MAAWSLKSLLNSLLAGNNDRRLVRSALLRQPRVQRGARPLLWRGHDQHLQRAGDQQRTRLDHGAFYPRWLGRIVNPSLMARMKLIRSRANQSRDDDFPAMDSSMA